MTNAQITKRKSLDFFLSVKVIDDLLDCMTIDVENERFHKQVLMCACIVHAYLIEVCSVADDHDIQKMLELKMDTIRQSQSKLVEPIAIL
jgi:hypothetical protein